MKTAKEMLDIAEAMRKQEHEEMFDECRVMDLIASEAAKGETSVYVSGLYGENLIQKLKNHGYSVSSAIYENKDDGVYERCISWDCEE